jgi:group I intron endonuclease
MNTYKSTNKLNGKFYIGSTVNFEKRKQEHLKSKENYPFQNALRKNPEAFEWEVWIDESDEPILEQALLDMWFGKEQCYNLNPSAKRPPSARGRRVKKETKQRISQRMKGRSINQKTRLAVSLSNKTRALSNETLTKKSESVKGEKNPFFGKKHDKSLKERWSHERKGLKWWYNTTTEETKMSKNCPGNSWRRGRKPK